VEERDCRDDGEVRDGAKKERRRTYTMIRVIQIEGEVFLTKKVQMGSETR
jgi:hypothetical protein